MLVTGLISSHGNVCHKDSHNNHKEKFLLLSRQSKVTFQDLEAHNPFKRSQTMPDFDTFLRHHSESLMQYIVEQIERVEGIKARFDASLEERWNALRDNSNQQRRTA
jgi:hypothetical protein